MVVNGLVETGVEMGWRQQALTGCGAAGLTSVSIPVPLRCASVLHAHFNFAAGVGNVFYGMHVSRWYRGRGL
jgi:hypothetical protein